MTSNVKLRAVFYVRLSRDSEVSTSIEGQNADLYRLAEREGWEIVAVFEDNGRSGGKQRENALAALDMLRHNEADVLAVYAYDRWSRMGIADSAEVINAVYERQRSAKRGATPPPLFYAAREGIRSDQEGWEIRVAFAADVAQKERDRMVARRKAAIQRMRESGRNPGNGPAPYGYRSAPFDNGRPGRRFVPDPEEAAIVREVGARLVRGETSYSIAKDLNRRAVPMPRSAARLAIMRGEDPTGLDTGRWSGARIGELWRSEYLLGRVTVKTNRSEDGNGTRNGELVIDPATGLPLQAYEPVLDLETALAIRERFRTSKTAGRPRPARKTRILSGWTVCGVCGCTMYPIRAGRSGRDGDRPLYYRCSGLQRGYTCSGVRVRGDWLEAEIEARYLADFGDRPAVMYVEDRGSPEVLDEIARVMERIEAIGRSFADPAADVPDLLAQRERLVARLADLKAEEQIPTARRIELGKTWAELYHEADEVELKLGYLRDAYKSCTVYPAKAPERYTLTYADTPEAEALAAILRDEELADLP